MLLLVLREGTVIARCWGVIKSCCFRGMNECMIDEHRAVDVCRNYHLNTVVHPWSIHQSSLSRRPHSLPASPRIDPCPLHMNLPLPHSHLHPILQSKYEREVRLPLRAFDRERFVAECGFEVRVMGLGDEVGSVADGLRAKGAASMERAPLGRRVGEG